MKIKYDKRYFRGTEDAISVTNEEIEEYVNETFNSLVENPKKYDYELTATGDSMIVGFKYDNEIDIMVCRNYEEVNILKNPKGDWNVQDYTVYDRYDGFDYDDLLDVISTLEQELELLRNNNENKSTEWYYNVRPEYNPRKEV